MTEVFFSFDAETSGQVPGLYSMLTFGCCLVEDTDRSFEASLKPIGPGFEQAALDVTGLTMEGQERDGERPEIAIQHFVRWVDATAAGAKPVMVGLAAAFDWQFVNYYCHLYAGRNPFGTAPLDIKAYWAGKTGCEWDATRSSRMEKVISPVNRPDHTPLSDAIYQAEMFRLARDYVPAGS